MVGIVSDEISRDFREALRIGTAVGIRRYEVRNLAAGRAPMCGDAAMREAEPVLMRAARKGVLHKHAASRKVSRLSHRIAQLGQ